MAIQLPKSSIQQGQENIGTALGQSLQQLAQNKVQEISQRKLGDTLHAAGVSPQIAQLISNLPPESQKLALQNLDAVLAYSASQNNQNAPEQMNAGQATQTMAAKPTSESAPTLGSIFQNPQHKIKREEMAQRERLKEKDYEQKERFHQQEFGSKQEERNYKRIAPILKQAEESGVPARKVVRSVDNILRILDSGQAITGIGGKITPAFLQTAEGQELLSEIGNLVLLEGELGKGAPSATKLGLIELKKPAIWQDPKAMRAIANRIKNDPETQKDIAEAEATEELIEATQGKYPENAVALINKRTKEIAKSKTNKYKSAVLREVEAQYPAAQLADGTETDDPETGFPLVVKDGKWTFQLGGE